MACAPFPPPPRFYEEFEPHSSKDFKCPAPPPLEGPYEVFGVRYDTSFAPQDPAAAHRDCGLDIEGDQQSPVATLRLLNRVLPEEYLKLMQVRLRPHHSPPAPSSPPSPPPRRPRGGPRSEPAREEIAADCVLVLVQLMIDRPILCQNEGDQQKIRDINQQRERVESIIASMHLTLSRFRPYQARQALITTLRAQVDRRRREAKDLRFCLCVAARGTAPTQWCDAALT